LPAFRRIVQAQLVNPHYLADQGLTRMEQALLGYDARPPPCSVRRGRVKDRTCSCWA